MRWQCIINLYSTEIKSSFRAVSLHFWIFYTSFFNNFLFVIIVENSQNSTHLYSSWLFFYILICNLVCFGRSSKISYTHYLVFPGLSSKFVGYLLCTFELCPFISLSHVRCLLRQPCCSTYFCYLTGKLHYPFYLFVPLRDAKITI